MELRRAAILVVLLGIPVPSLAGSISGRLLDSSGQPIGGAVVRWEAYRTDDRVLVDQTAGRTPARLGETKTSNDGRFHVALDRTSPAVSLRLIPPTGPALLLPGPHDPGAEIQLFDIHAAPAAPVRGRIVDEEGKGVAGARVRLTSSFTEEDSQAVSESQSSADGSFSIPDGIAAPRSLAASAPGFVSIGSYSYESRGSEERIVLKRGGDVVGTVTDAAGKPVSEAVVIAGSQAVETDSNGGFRLSGVLPGRTPVLALWKQDYAARAMPRVERNREVSVALRLARGAAIEGVVVAEGTGKPVAGARAAAAERAFVGSGIDPPSSRSDSRGRFRVGGLAGRAHTVEVSRPGYIASSINGVTAGSPSAASLRIALARAATLSGRVTDEKGEAIAGARVRLEGGDQRVFFRWAARPAAVTGPDGGFRFQNLEPTRGLVVRARKPGYAEAKKFGVTLRAGETTSNITLALKRGLEARGRVLDAQGLPIAGAELRVALRENTANQGQYYWSGNRPDPPDALTGTDGSFVISGLTAGEYSATVTREPFAPKTVTGLAVTAADQNVWPPITLAGAVSISGTVTGSQGLPIVGARVTGYRPGTPGSPLDGGMTDIQGHFQIAGLAPGQPVQLSVSAEGYASDGRRATPPAEGVVIVLKTAATIRGRVEDSETKRPVTAFSLARGTLANWGGGSSFQVTDSQGAGRPIDTEDGSFEVTGVPPGKATLQIAASGYRTGMVSVDTKEGETKEGILVALVKGSGVSGRVLDPNGTGVPNATVRWDAAGEARSYSWPDLRETASDADGRFRFEGLPPGRLRISASHRDYADGSREVDSEKESSVDLTLGGGASIAGMVVDRDGRSPVPGSLVNLRGQGDVGSDSTRTDDSGNFVFEHLKAGRFRLTAQVGMGQTQAREVVLAESQRQDGVLLSMRSAGSRVRGAVSGLPGGMLGGVRISAFAADYSDSTLTDESGAFTLQDVPSGMVRIRAATSRPSDRSMFKTAEIPESGGEISVQIPFDGAGRLAGRVTQGDRPLSGAWMSASPEGAGAARASSQTDSDGRYALEGLTDGVYEVFVSTMRGFSTRKTVTLSGDTTFDITIPLVGIAGTVTDEDGEPLEGVTLQAESGKETSAYAVKSATTDSTGRYSIDGIDPGTYQVTAKRAGYESRTRPATVESETITMTFALPRGAGLSIQVSDGLTGLALRGVQVLAVSGGTVAFNGYVSLDAAGKGEIAALAPGRYAVSFFAWGYAPRTLPAVGVPSPALAVAVTPGGRVEIRLEVSATLRLRDGSGAIYLFSPGRLDGSVSLLPPGTAWENVAPGNYQLLVSAPGTEKSYSLTVTEGQTTRVTVQ